MKYHAGRYRGAWAILDSDGTKVAGPFATRQEARDAGPWVVRTSVSLVMHGGNREGPVLFFNRNAAERCAASWRGTVERFQ